MNQRTLGLRVDDLAGKEVVAIAGGRGKARAIDSVLQSGVLSGLVTDEATASRILQPAAMAMAGTIHRMT